MIGIRITCVAGTRGFQITETTPGHGDIICCTFDIEVSIATVLEITVIHPNIRGFVQTKVVPTITVKRTRTLEDDIANDDVVSFEIQDTRFGCVLLIRYQLFTRQRHDSQVRFV